MPHTPPYMASILLLLFVHIQIRAYTYIVGHVACTFNIITFLNACIHTQNIYTTQHGTQSYFIKYARARVRAHTKTHSVHIITPTSPHMHTHTTTH